MVNNRWCFFIAALVVIPSASPAESNLQALSRASRTVIRNAPHPSAKTMGHMPKDVPIAVLQQSSFTTKVGRVRDDWYQIAAPGGMAGWVFGGNLEVTVKPEIEARLKKGFVGIKSPPFPKGTEYFGGQVLRHYPNFGLDHIVWHGNVLMVWLNEIVGRLPKLQSKSRDVLVIPPFHYMQRDMLSGCISAEHPFDDLYVIVQEMDEKGEVLKPLKAWRIDTVKKAFIEISVKGVECHQ